MNCPVCNDVALVMTERQGVEIDYCPQCRGVWLDRGELDKIIERSETEYARSEPVLRRKGGHGDRGRGGGHGEGYDDGGDRRRGGFFGDLFGD